MQEIYDEASDDPDWVKQISLSLLSVVSPYSVSTASMHHAIPRHVVVRATIKTFSMVVRSGPTTTAGQRLLPLHSIPAARTSAPVPTARGKTHNLEISAQIAQVSPQIASVPVAAQPRVRIYSYAGVSFSWQPGQAVTFQSLPGPWACIAMHESSDMVQRSNPGSSAKGAFQIKSLMWAKYKLPDYPDTPNQATLAQQYHVALRIFQSDGFAEWETAPLCGV